MWHIKAEIEKIKKELSKCMEKEHRSSMRMHTMSPGDPRYASLEYDLKEAKEEQKKKDKEIEKLEETMFYRALIELDYKPHTRHFLNFQKYHRIGAFVLHGSQSSKYKYKPYSIRSLFTRLIDAIPDSIITPVLKYDLASLTNSRDAATLWRELGNHVGAGAWAEQPEIIKEVCNKLSREEPVIIVLAGIDYILPEDRQVITDDFWKPLVTAVRQQNPPGSLFMFLVDYRGDVTDWELPHIDRLSMNGSEKHHQPIRFPIVERFSGRDVGGWIEQWSEHLFDSVLSTLTESEPDNVAQIILDRSNDGEPDLVMGSICEHCGYKLERLDACLKL
jgi:hypothetical protein